MLFLIICLAFYINISKSDDYYSHHDIELCTTAQSPVIHQQNNIPIRYNSILEAYEAIFNTSADLQILSDSCYKINKSNRVSPPVLHNFDAFSIRIVIICIFIFTLPSKSNYELWKKIVKDSSKNREMLQKINFYMLLLLVMYYITNPVDNVMYIL